MPHGIANGVRGFSRVRVKKRDSAVPFVKKVHTEQTEHDKHFINVKLRRELSSSLNITSVRKIRSKIYGKTNHFGGHRVSRENLFRRADFKDYACCDLWPYRLGAYEPRVTF